MQFALKSALVRFPKESVTFIADHPFVVAIVSQANNVLFLGRLTEP